MLYSKLAEAYSRLESTTKRLEMLKIVVALLRETPPEDMEVVIYLTQGEIHPSWTGFPEVGMAEKMAVEAVSLATGAKKEEIHRLLREMGDLGLATEKLLQSAGVKRIATKPLTVREVYDAFDKIAMEHGSGSSERKIKRLADLLADASPQEARYVIRTVEGKLRLGLGDMTILDGLAEAFTGSKKNRDILERSYNLTSDLGYVATVLVEKGLDAVRGMRIVVSKPVRMMLAQRLSTAEEIVEKLNGKCSAEYKLDGERFQIHKQGSDIQIYSRRLENITHMYPDAREMALTHIKAREAIIEGEAVAVDPETNELRPFQLLMQRRRKYGIKEMVEKVPIAVYFFDCLYADGEDLTLSPYPVRRQRLHEVLKEDARFTITRSLESSEPREIMKFFDEAISDGCEGLIVKSMADTSLYQAGARSWLWVKLKRSYQSKMIEPVDLVIVGAFYGRGKRGGSYGALLAAAYDHEKDMFRTVCKIGSGFTDEDLAKMPKLFEEYRLDHKPARVDSLLEPDLWFDPAIVIEVLGDEITLSPIHTAAFGVLREGSGLAIRFPRFTGNWRPDKSPDDATTVEEVIDMYKAQLKKIEETP